LRGIYGINHNTGVVFRTGNSFIFKEFPQFTSLSQNFPQNSMKYGWFVIHLRLNT